MFLGLSHRSGVKHAGKSRKTSVAGSGRGGVSPLDDKEGDCQQLVVQRVTISKEARPRRKTGCLLGVSFEAVAE